MKYFVISDVHSYYTIMRQTLLSKGFDERNPDHKVILCGDAFDRGNESKRMFNWLKKLTKLDKLIYIRGNHEDLLMDILSSGRVGLHDVTNGTYSTIMQLGNAKHGTKRDLILKGKTYYYELRDDVEKYATEFRTALINVKSIGLAEFIADNCVDYFETEHYIFVHGWTCEEYDLTKCSRSQWDQARWQNGMNEFLNTKFKFGKTIVVGHWHCNWLRDLYAKAEDRWKDFSIETSTKENGDCCIAIDACTATSGQVNVLVIEE